MRKNEFKKLKVGDQVMFHSDILRFYKDKAYDFNVICGTNTMTEDGANSYFAWKLFGMGFPYHAIVTRLKDDVGNGPGCHIEIQLQHGVQLTSIFSYKHFKKVKNIRKPKIK